MPRRLPPVESAPVARVLELDRIQLRDPELAQVLERVGAGDTGLPRERITAPICRQPELSDTALFEEPGDPQRTAYLPRYRLATRMVSGAEQYAAAIEQRAQGWSLTLFLAKYPAPELGAAAQTARELPHEASVLLRYRTAGAGATTRELPFTERSEAGAELRVALAVGSLPERDELIYALSDPAAQAQLVVRRSARVALPLPGGAGVLGGDAALQARPLTAASSQALGQALLRNEAMVAVQPRIEIMRPMPGDLLRQPVDDRLNEVIKLPRRPLPARPVLPTPQIVVTPDEEYEAGKRRWVRYTVSVTNAGAFNDALFAPAPDLPPCGNNTNAARTWVNIHADDGRYLYGFCALDSAASLRKLWFAVEVGQSPPPAVYIVLNDRLRQISARSNSATVTPPPPVPRFRELLGVLDSLVQPFYFNRTDHAYLFRGAGGGGAASGGLTPWAVRWGDALHNYYQDAVRPHLFYFLPERLRLTRRPEPPFKPFMSLRVAAPPAEGEATISFTYVAVPWSDPARLAAAADELSRKAPQLAGALPELQPLATSAVRFVLERPQAVGSLREERPLASANVLRSALCDTLTMSERDFQPIFDALMGSGAALFHGKLLVELPGLPPEEIPFVARLDDMVGRAMLDSAGPEAAGGLPVTLTNAVESPLRVDGLAATLRRGDGPAYPATLQGLSLPVARLEPGQQLAVSVARAGGVPEAGALKAQFATDGVRTIPDPAAILDLILDDQQRDYFRTVVVVAPEALFAAPADAPERQIEELLVDFEAGEFARLSAAAREARVRVDHPFGDVLLGRPITSTYTYRVTVLRKDGGQTTSEPLQGSAEVLFVTAGR